MLDLNYAHRTRERERERLIAKRIYMYVDKTDENTTIKNKATGTMRENKLVTKSKNITLLNQKNNKKPHLHDGIKDV